MSKKIYFQYQKDINLPIFLSADLSQFDSTLVDFLSKMKFTKLADKDEAAALEIIKNDNYARVLHLSEASFAVDKQIKSSLESDYYGAESIIPQSGYRVYRYKSVGLMVYSFGAKEWQLGCYRDFGSEANTYSAKIMINRFLTWGLVASGILGLWGVGVEDSVVAQKMVDSNGEAIFVDIKNQRIISQDGVRKIPFNLKILKLDSSLRGRNVRMSSEELIGFLSIHCSYLDSAGLSVPVRQMIQSLSKMSQGMLHPQESFRPRTDLSL